MAQRSSLKEVVFEANKLRGMRGLFLSRINIDRKVNIGVINKCRGQVEALRSYGLEVDWICLSNSGILLNGNLVRRFKVAWFYRRWTAYFYFFFFWIPQVLAVLKNRPYDFIYIRFALLHPGLVIFTKNYKRKGKQIILEIPTYPYQGELNSKFYRFAIQLDKVILRHIKGAFDGIVHFGLEDRIWDIPTIRIRNGIDAKANLPAKTTSISGQLRLIAVGQWSYWHGIDRLLLGLRQYRNKKNSLQVTLKIVGEGPELDNYKKLINEYGLTQSVALYSTTSGERLDLLFEDSDIAIGNLGIHRKRVQQDSSIKHRAYCSRAIPFVLSTEDPDFPSSLSFVSYVTPTDEPIDIALIVAFYHKLLPKLEDARKQMRKYCIDYLSWEAQLKDVFNFLQKNQAKINLNNRSR